MLNTPTTRFRNWLLTSTALCLLLTSPALAHVKWFSQFNYDQPAKQLPEITSITFWAMFILSLFVLTLAVMADEWVERSPLLRRVGEWFESKQQSSLLVIRVAAFATLIVAWQQGTLFAPELIHGNPWIERLQFVVLLLLLFPATTSVAGAGMVGLWMVGVAKFGWFHLFDYVNFLGIAYFLIVRPLSSEWWRGTALPVMYASVGFALMWLGCEKLVYPQWALYILEQNPVLTLGLPQDFFLTAAAFIELGLGFMLLICLFSRSLAVTITLVFFLTTCIFGKVEIIGHTLVHAALIVFLFEGAGSSFTPPALFHRTNVMRIAFATVNFGLAVFGVLAVYIWAADQIEPPIAHLHPKYEITNRDSAPTIKISAIADTKGGWNVQLKTTNFGFAPDQVGAESIEGEGHAHLYLDGQKIARVYSEWYHLPPLPLGKHNLRATLNTHDHSDYCLDGDPIGAEVEIEQATAAASPTDISRVREFLCIGVK